MHYKIIYEPEAEQALEQISCYYIDQVGYELASDIIETIIEAINSLQTMPKRCQKSYFSENVHRLVLPKLPYLVYFCILEISQEVVILEICKRVVPSAFFVGTTEAQDKNSLTFFKSL